MKRLPTWGELYDFYCSIKWRKVKERSHLNPYYEKLATRRYNYSAGHDLSSFRLVFLKDVLGDPRNKTLVRNGRFIWCHCLQYEGRNAEGLRQVSFSVDRGKKRFLVAENNILCVPAKTFVNNNRYFRYNHSTFKAFSSVFAYKKSVRVMCKNSAQSDTAAMESIVNDNPYKPGTLVAPRLGYFYPTPDAGTPQPPSHLRPTTEHPYGIIVGPSLDNNDYGGREFYRVRFGATTYERVHPIQMEIVNEV